MTSFARARRVAARPAIAACSRIAFVLAVHCAVSGLAASDARGQSTPPDTSQQETTAVVARAADELANGRAAEAEDLLRDALRKGRDPALLVELGAVLIERADALDASSELGKSLRIGVLEEALEVYLEAAKSAATGSAVDGAIGAATCHSLLERPAEAEATMRAALAALRTAQAPPSERRRLVSALVHYLTILARVDDAQRIIDEGSERGDLDAGQAALERLRIAATRVDEQQALPLALAASAAGADSFETAYLCWDAMGERRLEALLNVYSRLLEKRPGDAALLYFRGTARLRLGDGPGAIADLEHCVDTPTVGARARLFLGRALIRANRAEEALPHFERLLTEKGELVPDALNGVIGVAVQRARSRQFKEALDLYQKVLALDPTNLWAHIGEPLCFKSLGEFEKASAAYDEGLRLLPEQPQLLNDYALLVKARGERAKAKELFERALGASGESPEEQRAAADGGENLGIIAYRDEHDLEAASRYFARTLLLDPNRPRIRFYRELCLCDADR